MDETVRSRRRVERLTRTMRKHHISALDLAKASGVKRTNLSALMSGSRPMSSKMLVRLLTVIEGEAKLPGDVLAEHREDVLSILDDYGFHDVHVFGSITRDQDMLDSDVDLYATSSTGSILSTYRKAAEAQERLEEVLGVQVDFSGVPDALHDLIRKESYAL